MSLLGQCPARTFRLDHDHCDSSEWPRCEDCPLGPAKPGEEPPPGSRAWDTWTPALRQKTVRTLDLQPGDIVWLSPDWKSPAPGSLVKFRFFVATDDLGICLRRCAVHKNAAGYTASNGSDGMQYQAGFQTEGEAILWAEKSVIATWGKPDGP